MSLREGQRKVPCLVIHIQGSSSRVQREYAKEQDLADMVREEKTGTAEDQLRLFERSLVVWSAGLLD